MTTEQTIMKASLLLPVSLVQRKKREMAWKKGEVPWSHKLYVSLRRDGTRLIRGMKMVSGSSFIFIFTICFKNKLFIKEIPWCSCLAASPPSDNDNDRIQRKRWQRVGSRACHIVATTTTPTIHFRRRPSCCDFFSSSTHVQQRS